MSAVELVHGQLLHAFAWLLHKQHKIAAAKQLRTGNLLRYI